MTIKKILFLLSVFMSIVGTKALAYDISVKNSDGVVIFYNYYNNGIELEVTYGSSARDSYYGVVNIPEEVTFMDRTRKVTSIGDHAFFYCDDLISVTMPNSIVNIGVQSFEGCEKLSAIKIPSSLKKIGRGAFQYCHGLEKVIVKDIAAWCNIDFGDDWLHAYSKHIYSDESTEITNLVIPQGVSEIKKLAFSHFYNVSSVSIPNSVTTIGGYSFTDSGITSLNLPNSVITIGESAFYSTLLTSLIIPNSVITIESRAFSCCRYLKTVTISNSVKTLGREVFDFTDLQTVVTMIKEPYEIYGKNEEYGNVFSLNTFNNATLYVPLGTISAYKTTEGWKDFLFIEEGLPTGINNVGDNTIKENKRYTIDGKIINSPQKGINIIQMENGTIQKRIIK